MKNSIYLLIVSFFTFTISSAQIPNSGFEAWNNMGSYNNPTSWTSLNDMTAPMSTYTCAQGTPGNPGSYYLKLTSKSVTGMAVVPGMAVCGTMNTTTMQVESGFPFASRPANLTGNWQHMIFGNSQGYIDVVLTRWDTGSQSRLPVASAHRMLTGMAMSWAAFTIPLIYLDSNNPDSCIITMSASGSTPTANDYLWVDNLNFTGTVTGIFENNIDAKISFYPNPATENLFLELSALKDKNVSIIIFDIGGKKVIEINTMEVRDKNTIDISTLPKGNFVLNIYSTEGTITRNFVKQ